MTRVDPSNRLRWIRAISFDGDMTLWNFQKVMRHALGHALEELRRRHPCRATEELTIERMIGIRDGVAAELKGKISNLEEIRFLAFKRTVEHVGIRDDNLTADLNALYLRHRFADIELYEDVRPVLDFLRGKTHAGGEFGLNPGFTTGGCLTTYGPQMPRVRRDHTRGRIVP